VNLCFLLLLGAVPPPVDFDTDVLPVLTKAGCNAGACHGAAAGRGGFKLSLFGGDPAADQRAIARELEGRRVNLAHPERSLLLLKPTWQLDHEGGERFTADGSEAAVLLQWIRVGARRTGDKHLIRLEVTPAQTAFDRLPANYGLSALAQFSDGTQRDVSHQATYTPADPAATEVDPRGGVKVQRPGRHSIVVRFLTETIAVQVTAAYPQPSLAADKLPRNNWIDDEINATLTALRLPLSPQADEAALLRRVTLDLSGRLPPPERILAYLADRRSPQEKFAAEVERLLASPEFTEQWTYKLAEWLRIQPGPNDREGTEAYYAWVRKQVEGRRPLNELVAELITADGDSHLLGPPNFHRSAGDARGEAEHVAETLLAVRLRCANCHNHPLDRWTQDDYHGLAAIFARLDRGREVKLKSSGEVAHPATGDAAIPRIPGAAILDPQADGRPRLAAWLTSTDNPYFARAWVNRLWDSLLGRGLVHPVDDLRDTNPASHPALLERLTQDFVAASFDLRHTLRQIALSAAYQRSAATQAGNLHDDRFYSHALPRQLSQEVLLRAVCTATGVAEHALPLSFAPPTGMVSDRPRQLPFDPLAVAVCAGQPGQARDALAQPPNDLAAQLHWLNGPVVNAKLNDRASALAELSKSNAPAQQLIETYYLRTLSRLPTASEQQFWQRELAGGDWAQKCQDFAWSLLSCREFVTNH